MASSSSQSWGITACLMYLKLFRTSASVRFWWICIKRGQKVSPRLRLTVLTGSRFFSEDLKGKVKGSFLERFKALFILLSKQKLTRRPCYHQRERWCSYYQKSANMQKSLEQPRVLVWIALIILMIQITKDKNIQKQLQEGFKQQSPSADSYIVFRIIYASILIAFLLLISFYFDLLSDYDALSLVLGFVICIILQFSFLSYYFREEMKKYKIDEIGVLKWKIKLIFGELNQKHIDKKNKIKYYRHEGNEKDRLFHKDNQQIYQNVMSFLRGKEEPNFIDMIAKTKVKWSFLEEKMILLEKFMTEMQKQYDGRRSIYNRYKTGIYRVKQRKDCREWQQFLKQQEKADPRREQLMNKVPLYSQYGISNAPLNSGRLKSGNPQKLRLNWQIFNWFILEKSNIIESQVICLKENIMKEYNIYIKTIKQSKENNSKIRDKLLADFKAARDDKNHIVKQIEKTTIRYSDIKESLQNNRIKQQYDVQALLKREFDLRLQKLQLQNYEIKISRAQSLILSTSELLYNHLEQEENELQDHLNKLNSKFTNYLNMMAGVGEARSPAIKKYFEQQGNMENSNLDTPESIKDYEFLLQKYTNRRKCELAFKNYLIEAINLFKEIENNHRDSQAIIQQYKPKFQRSSSGDGRSESRGKKDMTGARLHYYASNVKDLKILKMFQKLNSFECKLAEKIGSHLLKQSTHLSQFQDGYGMSYSREMKRAQQEMRRKQQQLKKLRRRTNKQEAQLMNQQVYFELATQKDRISGDINQYFQIYKISTTLVDIIEAMIENEALYEKYASQLAEQQQFQRSNQQADTEETRARQRHVAYANCIQRQQSTQFDDDTLMNDDYLLMLDKDNQYMDSTKSRNQVELSSFANYSLKESLAKQKNKEALKMVHLNTFKENLIRSREMVNKLLGVFFNEWTKSQHFHQFIKQQLLTSLNRKKPDIVQNLQIEYFKIVDRVKSVGPIKQIRAHQSEIYRCLADIVLDFKGRIAVQIGTKFKISKKPALQIKLLIKQFECPIRLCFTPFSLGKSYASLLQRPKISIDYSVTLGGFNLTKIPFFTQIIKTYIVLKLRKKFLWPKRITLPVPLAYKSTLDLAIIQRNRYERDRQKIEKKVQ